MAASVTGKLAWVKLQTMQVFWPACVYDSYTEANKHALELGGLRKGKPALDAEDRVVYFFGVGPHACHVHSTSGPAPNLQQCVSHEDDIEMMPFVSQHADMCEDFATICRAFHVAEENIMRARKNSCFQRACEEALRFRMTVNSDEEARKLLLAFLATANKANRSDSSLTEHVSVKVQKSSSASSPSRTVQSRSTPSKASVRESAFFSPPQSKLSKALNSSPSPSKKVLPGLDRIVDECWQHMLAEGWETMAQADGQVLYKMPGISFFNFRPNENIFDSLVKACNKFLSTWTRATQDDETAQSKLMDFLWPMVEESGWVKISSSNETWYMMPNTAFNQCVPNVTIFRSKALAVAKYLEVSGLLQVEATDCEQTKESESTSKPIAEVTEVDNQEMDEEMDVDESDEEVEGEAEEEGESNSSEVEVESDEENNDELSEESEEEEVVVVKAKSAKSAKSTKASIKTKQRKAVAPAKSKSKPGTAKAAPAVAQFESPPSAAKKLTFGSKPKVTIPPFKCTFGKVEGELRARGWYWKSVKLVWRYFKPSCRLKDISELQSNVDYFDGQSMLEDYLEVSGLYDDIRATLRREHEKMYNPSSDSSDEEEASSTKTQPSKPKPTSTLTPRDAKEDVSATKKQPSKPKSMPALSRRSSAAVNDENDKENRSNNVMPRAVPARTSSRRRRNTTTSLDCSKVKFGDIWAALAKQGWHFKTGMFGYDYFTPNCQNVNDGVLNVDYFPSDTMLIEYLKTSGIWAKVARQIVKEEETIDVTSSGDEKEEAEPVSPAKRQALFRREKRRMADRDSEKVVDEETPSNKPAKKAKVAGTFNTPTEQKRSGNDAEEDGHESDKADKISPETVGQKAAAHDNSTSSHLSRNLADCFTPSPGNSKKGKSSSTSSSEPASPHELYSEAIQKLTLGHSLSKLQYRDEESRRVHDFFQTCFTQRHGSSMYISGAPGCGKSALLKASEDRITQLYREVNETQDTKRLVRAHVNAIALNDSSKLYCQLAEMLTNQMHMDGASAFEAIERATNCSYKRSKTMILILDEIDILLKKNGVESDLCRLFELAHRPSHSFILIGIANQVDFTERHLPLLQQQLPDCKPQVVIFKPYVHQTIELILMDRLGGKQNALKMLNAHGISFLARKIASTTGDIRMALDICRRVLQHRLDTASEAGENGAALLLTPVPLTDMLRLVKGSLESKSSHVLKSLPRNLQMILFASTRLVASFATDSSVASSSALFGIDELYAGYCEASQEAGVFKPLTFREFRSALETLSSEGLLGATELKKQIVKLLFTPSELLQAFRNDAYFGRLV